MSGLLVLGVDAGGSSSIARAAAANDASRLVGQWSGRAANLTVHGVDEVAASLIKLLHTASDQVGKAFAAVAIGVAGAGDELLRDRLERELVAAFPASPIVVTHDGAPLFEYGEGGGAVVAIAGTGSFVIGRSAHGSEKEVGRREPKVIRSAGWGPLLGDEGSAYRVVLDTLAQAVKQIDPLDFDAMEIPANSAAAPCLLAILDELDGTDLGTIKMLANNLAQRPRLARCFHRVLKLADSGDVLAQSVVQRHAAALASDVGKVWSRIARDGLQPTLVLSGGALVHQPSYRGRVVQAIEEILGPITPVLVKDPVEGAIRMAIRLLPVS
ncbi:MAG TPA: hypothetical protein EYQ75_11800 [Planctomycetaceae bacterium]|nr:hypothetical protein [Planctomycetaceae bacterium]